MGVKENKIFSGFFKSFMQESEALDSFWIKS